MQKFAIFALFACACHVNENEIKETGVDALPEIRVDPQTINFGEIGEEDSLLGTFTIYNDGLGALSVDQVEISGSSAFTILTTDLDFELANGHSTDILIEFTAGSDDPDASAIVYSNDPNNPMVEVSLIGATLSRMISVSPNPIDFGLVVPGQFSESVAKITNTGDLSVTIESVETDNEAFSITSGTFPYELASEKELELTIQFAPPISGGVTAALTIKSNAETPEVQLIGEGVKPGITGTICDPSGGEPVAGARVWVEIDENGDGIVDYIIETTTDSNGYYLLEEVPEGTYTVYVEKGSYEASIEVEVIPGELTQASNECMALNQPTITVITGEHDKIEDLLDKFGISYNVFDGVTTGGNYLDLLRNPSTLSSSEVLFINCGVDLGWLDYKDEIGTNLANYVEQGGSLYISDWSYLFVEAAFPEIIDFYGDDSVPGEAASGAAAEIAATIEDEIMQAVIGSTTLEVVFDLDSWVVPQSALATTIISADVETIDGSTLLSAPIVLSFSHGDGKVIFTSFHNEAQASEDMISALGEIILSL